MIELAGVPAPFNQVNIDTVIMASITMGLVLIIALFIRMNLKV